MKRQPDSGAILGREIFLLKDDQNSDDDHDHDNHDDSACWDVNSIHSELTTSPISQRPQTSGRSLLGSPGWRKVTRRCHQESLSPGGGLRKGGRNVIQSIQSKLHQAIRRPNFNYSLGHVDQYEYQHHQQQQQKQRQQLHPPTPAAPPFVIANHDDEDDDMMRSKSKTKKNKQKNRKKIGDRFGLRNHNRNRNQKKERKNYNATKMERNVSEDTGTTSQDVVLSSSLRSSFQHIVRRRFSLSDRCSKTSKQEEPRNTGDVLSKKKPHDPSQQLRQQSQCHDYKYGFPPENHTLDSQMEQKSSHVPQLGKNDISLQFGSSSFRHKRSFNDTTDVFPNKPSSIRSSYLPRERQKLVQAREERIRNVRQQIMHRIDVALNHDCMMIQQQQENEDDLEDDISLTMEDLVVEDDEVDDNERNTDEHRIRSDDDDDDDSGGGGDDDNGYEYSFYRKAHQDQDHPPSQNFRQNTSSHHRRLSMAGEVVTTPTAITKPVSRLDAVIHYDDEYPSPPPLWGY